MLLEVFLVYYHTPTTTMSRQSVDSSSSSSSSIQQQATQHKMEMFPDEGKWASRDADPTRLMPVEVKFSSKRNPYRNATVWIGGRNNIKNVPDEHMRLFVLPFKVYQQERKEDRNKQFISQISRGMEISDLDSASIIASLTRPNTRNPEEGALAWCPLTMATNVHLQENDYGIKHIHISTPSPDIPFRVQLVDIMPERGIRDEMIEKSNTYFDHLAGALIQAIETMRREVVQEVAAARKHADPVVFDLPVRNDLKAWTIPHKPIDGKYPQDKSDGQRITSICLTGPYIEFRAFNRNYKDTLFYGRILDSTVENIGPGIIEIQTVQNKSSFEATARRFRLFIKSSDIPLMRKLRLAIMTSIGARIPQERYVHSYVDDVSWATFFAPSDLHIDFISISDDAKSWLAHHVTRVDVSRKGRVRFGVSERNKDSGDITMRTEFVGDLSIDTRIQIDDSGKSLTLKYLEELESNTRYVIIVYTDDTERLKKWAEALETIQKQMLENIASSSSSSSSSLTPEHQQLITNGIATYC